MKRSANAFRFGLRAGNRTGFIPLSLSSRIGESEPMASAKFLVDQDLFGEIIDDLLLISIDPTCSEQDKESQIVRYGVKDTAQ